MYNEYEPLTKAEMREHQHDYTTGHPALYVGTYGKYNDGNLYGQWVDLATFDDFDEFIEYCYRLHADEEDPELMYQDFEGFPRHLYSESGFGEEEFDNVKMIAELTGEEKEAFEAYVSLFDEYDIDDFRDRYLGHFNSDQEFGEWYIDSLGGIEELGRQTVESYFDYEHFGRELAWGFSEQDGYYFQQR